MHTRAPWEMALLRALLIMLILLIITPASHAQNTQMGKTPTIVWANSFYGPNNSGLGLAVRHGVLGIGGTIFNFAGDTTTGMPPRPGGVGISGDIYLAADLSDWFALYGNVGYAGRMTTYSDQRELLRKSPQRDFLSVGGGLQISLASHLMFGGGYNLLIDTADYQGDPTDKPIQSAIAQVGYRF